VRRVLVIVASIVILLILVKAAGLREVADAWKDVHLRGIAISVACYYAALVVRIVSWRRLLGDGAPGFPALAPPLAMGFVLGHVAPAKSGEPLTALLVSRTFSIPLSRALSVLTVERGLQFLILLATFVPASALVAGRALELQGATRAAAVLLALFVIAVPLAAPALERIARWAVRIPRFGEGAARYLRTTADLLRSPRRVLPLLALATLFWLLQYLSLWAILDAGGAGVNLIDAAVVAGAAILGSTLTLLPLGTQDGISALVLGGLGVPLTKGFALALFHTLLSLACGLALVLVLPLLAPGARAGASAGAGAGAGADKKTGA
jgi:uncharacterized protein (TIRG00374 family)